MIVFVLAIKRLIVQRANGPGRALKGGKCARRKRDCGERGRKEETMSWDPYTTYQVGQDHGGWTSHRDVLGDRRGGGGESPCFSLSKYRGPPCPWVPGLRPRDLPFRIEVLPMYEWYFL